MGRLFSYAAMAILAAICKTPELKDTEDDVRVAILVDANLIEVYINEGESVISNVLYGLLPEICLPKGKEYTGLQIG